MRLTAALKRRVPRPTRIRNEASQPAISMAVTAQVVGQSIQFRVLPSQPCCCLKLHGKLGSRIGHQRNIFCKAP